MIHRRSFRFGVGGLMGAVAIAAIVANRLRPVDERRAIAEAMKLLQIEHTHMLDRNSMADLSGCDCRATYLRPTPEFRQGRLWGPGREKPGWLVSVSPRGSREVFFEIEFVEGGFWSGLRARPIRQLYAPEHRAIAPPGVAPLNCETLSPVPAP